MDISSVLSQLLENDSSYPIIKLAWDCQLDFNVNDVKEIPKITPSHFLKEIRLTTPERHALLCRQQKKIACWKPENEVTVEPAIIVFQSYRFGDVLSYPLTIRNISKVSQKVTVLMDETKAFKFDEGCQRVCKFPSGMQMSTSIKFLPDDDRDYYHKLIIITNNARFSIPIVCIGGRGILNIPDLIEFEKVPVKYLRTKTFPVCNVGTKPARFTLSITGPFCIKPEKGVILPKESFNLQLSQYSETLGIQEGDLKIKYENGEEVHCSLKTEVINADVELLPSEVNFEDTYMGMKSKVICSIRNNSEIILDFTWRKSDSRTSTSNSMYNLYDQDVDIHGGGDTLDRAIDYLEGCIDQQECLGDAVVAFGLEGNMQLGSEDLFTHDHFLIEPVIGQVQPYSSTDIFFIFSPQAPTKHHVQAYLDVTGLDTCIPIDILGSCIGPKFQFGFDTLNLGTIFLGGDHSYEIPVVNVSEIFGKVETHSSQYKSEGNQMTIEPQSISLSPTEHGAFYLSFPSVQPGSFEEEISFFVPTTGEEIFITVKWSVSFPSLHFVEKGAFMGNVSFGFPKAIQISLINDSLNFVDVHLKMVEDGTDPYVDYNRILQSFKFENFRFDSNPAEYMIEPDRFVISPHGMQKVMLTVCAAHVRNFTTKVVCNVKYPESDTVHPVAWLPVNGQCTVPGLQCESPDLRLVDCYMQHPYPNEYQVYNPSDLPVCYCLVQQPCPKITIESDNLVGVAKPRQTTSIPFKMISSRNGTVTVYFDLYSVGRDEKLLTLSLRIDSVQPDLEPSHAEVDFGAIAVLESCSKEVAIVNKSPLTVQFDTKLKEGGRNGDTWEFNPSSGIIEPYSNVTIVVTVTLLEGGLHTAVMDVSRSASLPTNSIKMRAEGIGSGIMFSPSLENGDIMDFGTIFTRTQKSFDYEVKNLGHLPKMFEWLHAKDPEPVNVDPKQTKRKYQPETSNLSKPKPTDFTQKSSFSVNPGKKVLGPGSTMTVTFSTTSNHATSAEDGFNLWTYTTVKYLPVDTVKKRTFDKGNNSNNSTSLKPVISRSIGMKCIYEEPTIVLSKKSITLRIDAIPINETYMQHEHFHVDNMGILPFEVIFKTKFPFGISTPHNSSEIVEEWIHEFQPHERIDLTVYLDARHVNKEQGAVCFDSRIDATYFDYHGKETVALRGEIYFPSLTFSKGLIDFKTIVNGTEAMEEFSVANQGVHSLNFKWYIKANATEILYAIDSEENDAKAEVALQQSLTKAAVVGTDDFAILTASEFNLIKDDKPSALLGSETDQNVPKITISGDPQVSQSIDKVSRPLSKIPSEATVPESEASSFMRRTIHRAKLLRLAGLLDPPHEVEDENNYLSYCREMEEKKMKSVALNEIIDIIPMSGVIPAGQSQNFVVVFYGHPDISFNTTALCELDGGTGSFINIRGASTHMAVPEIPTPMTVEIEEIVIHHCQPKIQDSSDIPAPPPTAEIEMQPVENGEEGAVVEELPKRKCKKKKKKTQPEVHFPPTEILETPEVISPEILNSPEIIFPKIIDSVTEGDNRVYIRDENCYDFGPTIVPMRHIERSASTTHHVFTHRVKHDGNVAQFVVRNPSLLPAICTFSLLHERRKYFEFQPPHFIVEPGQEQEVTLWAYPRVADVVVEDILVLSIKDNPDPFFFKVRVLGTSPLFTNNDVDEGTKVEI